MLENKILGLVVTLDGNVTVSELCHYLQMKKDVVEKVVNELIDDNKIEWGPLKESEYVFVK